MLAKKTKIKKKNQDQILCSIRDRIIDGYYRPGSKLVVSDLANEYAVSRSMLAEVFVHLETQKLIKKEPYKGYVVREVNLENLLEIMDIREVLEGLAVRLATENSSPEDWADLEKEINESWDDIIKNYQFEKHLELSIKFRNKIFDAAKNKELSDLTNNLFAIILIVQRRIAILPGRMKSSAEEQRQVLRAIIEGNASEAERLKRLNIKSGKEYLQKYKDWII